MVLFKDTNSTKGQTKKQKESHLIYLQNLLSKYEKTCRTQLFFMKSKIYSNLTCIILEFLLLVIPNSSYSFLGISSSK